MNRKKRIITIIVAMAMLCMMSMTAFADTNVHISLPKDQVWTSSYAVSRTGKYSYVSASLDSVYPISGSDYFTKIQARLVNSVGLLIMTSTYEVLKEGDGYQQLQIKEGYLASKTVYIQFRGNTSSAAEAIVNYLGN